MRQRTPLLTAAEVAEWLGISKGWVHDHSARGKQPQLPYVRLGGQIRFEEAAIEEWIARNRQNARGRAA